LSGRFDAAMMRTLADTVWSAPSGLISPSWRNRSRLIWNDDETSEISSRNTVPPSAARNSPRRSEIAPVNAPRLWPNSSDCNSASGVPPQFWTSSGLPLRCEL
jgi:hypothetical protein